MYKIIMAVLQINYFYLQRLVSIYKKALFLYSYCGLLIKLHFSAVMIHKSLVTCYRKVIIELPIEFDDLMCSKASSIS